MISYEPSFDPLSSLDPRIDLTRPYYDQGQWFHLDRSISDHVLGVHGTFRFYHKSFDDFLCDPTRSGAFCVKIPAFRSKLLDQLIQNHNNYASSYAIDGSSMYFLCCICPKLVIPDLVSAPGIIGSSTALSWPHGTEFVDSCLKLTIFSFLSLICDPNIWDNYDVPLAILQPLADLDYCKSLIAIQKLLEIGSLSSRDVFGTSATVRTLSHTIFDCIGAEEFGEVVPA